MISLKTEGTVGDLIELLEKFDKNLILDFKFSAEGARIKGKKTEDYMEGNSGMACVFDTSWQDPKDIGRLTFDLTFRNATYQSV